MDRQDLEAKWRKRERQRLLMALTLVLPALVYMAVLFVAPIAVFLIRSVDNAIVPRLLPQTIAALDAAAGPVTPSDALARSLAADLLAAKEAGQATALARHLAQYYPAFRPLIATTANKLSPDRPVASLADLVGVDRRWADRTPWVQLKLHGSAVSFDFFLRAFDLERHEDGIRPVPTERAFFLDVLARTLAISASVTLLCLVIGFPIAYQLAHSTGWVRAAILASVMLPFWTSLLIRTAAWMILLQGEGIINTGLVGLGLVTRAVELMGNRFAVYVAMVQILIPFMILPIYSAMTAVPPTQMRAAMSLGARPVTAFLRVYIPQCLQGIASGSMLVLIVALGYYVTPQLVGGPQDQMLASFIAFYINDGSNWGLAAALGAILLTISLSLYLVVNRSAARGRLVAR